MIGRSITLHQSWLVGEPIGQGAFGRVHEAVGSQAAAVKFVPKTPGADRELLFVELPDAANVMPIIDYGEIDDFWALVMPRAQGSLRDLLQTTGKPLAVPAAVPVLVDIATGLAELARHIVHRDLKPENVLLLDGHWCLADFGISRYAEASTAVDTHKYSLTPAYASPEQWRSEHATAAADVYAFGVMAYEMMAGRRPFLGPTQEDFRDQHLHHLPTPLVGVQPSLASLIEECLLKAPGARPAPESMLARLERLGDTARSAGLSALEEANRQHVLRQAGQMKASSLAASLANQRQDLLDAARQLHGGVASELLDSLMLAAPSSVVATGRGASWTLQLGDANLSCASFSATSNEPWDDWQAPAFSVIAHSELLLRVPPDRSGYEGRSHSLWYCDAREAGRFEWFETSFMVSPLLSWRARVNPFALPPGREAAQAVWNGMSEYQVAWPFTVVTPGEMTELVERWAGWLASASTGGLCHPSRMPERDTEGSWRRQ